MAYNRRNLLERIVDIQRVTMEHTHHGVTQEYVYTTIIFPTYRISRRAYYYYLGTNAKMELNKMEATKQLSLF